MQLTDADIQSLERLITIHRRQSKVATLLGYSQFAICRYRNGKGPRTEEQMAVFRAAMKKALRGKQ